MRCVFFSFVITLVVLSKAPKGRVAGDGWEGFLLIHWAVHCTAQHCEALHTVHITAQHCTALHTALVHCPRLQCTLPDLCSLVGIQSPLASQVFVPETLSDSRESCQEAIVHWGDARDGNIGGGSAGQICQQRESRCATK